jgi:tRNA G18 (ribose-2'-O)-methylase SpoU
MTRGYFEIGVYRPKTETNIGTLWRTAFQMGAAGIFTVAERWPARQSSDTTEAWRHLPYRKYADLAALLSALPKDADLVALEIGGKPIRRAAHPERAVYLLGAEDDGLPDDVRAVCTRTWELPCIRTASYNVAVAGALTMFDRLSKSPEPSR